MLGCLTAVSPLRCPHDIFPPHPALRMSPNPMERTVTYSPGAQFGNPALTPGQPLLLSTISNLSSSCHVWLLNPSKATCLRIYSADAQFWPLSSDLVTVCTSMISSKKQNLNASSLCLKKPFNVCLLFLEQFKHLIWPMRPRGSELRSPHQPHLSRSHPTICPEAQHSTCPHCLQFPQRVQPGPLTLCLTPSCPFILATVYLSCRPQLPLSLVPVLPLQKAKDPSAVQHTNENPY